MGGRTRASPARRLRDAGSGGPSPGECHVWVARAQDRPRWRDLLAPDDVARVAACRTVAARREVVTSAALRRLVAAHYSGVPPAAVVVRRRCSVCGAEGHGRPQLGWATSPGRGLRSAPGIPDVSSTHSAGLVLLAVTGCGRVGVDLEARERPVDVAALARLVCSPAERVALDALAGSRRRRRFLELWVRKEAVLKLVGVGLTGPWRDVDVRSDTVRAGPDLWPERVFTHDLPGVADAAGCRLPGDGSVVAALATTWPVAVVRYLGLSDLRSDLRSHLRSDLRSDLRADLHAEPC